MMGRIGRDMNLINIKNREKKKGKGRKENTDLTYFLSFVSWNGADIEGTASREGAGHWDAVCRQH